MRYTADPAAAAVAPPPGVPVQDGPTPKLGRGLAGSAAAHALLALALGAAAFAADALPQTWHAPLGWMTAALLMLWFIWGLWRPAPRVASQVDAALPALRAALAAAVALLAVSGALLGDATWGARVAVATAQEALAGGAAALLGLHALAEWAVLGWAHWRDRRPTP